MNTQQKRSITRVLTIGLWGSFLLCNLLLVVAMAAQANILGVLLLLFVFVGELFLLARYVKWVAQWRSILLFWGIYSLARIAAAIMAAAGNDLAATLARMLIIARVMALDNRRYYGFLPVLESQYQSSLQINSDCRCYFHLNPNKLPEACVESRRLADLIDRLLPSVAPAMDKN